MRPTNPISGARKPSQNFRSFLFQKKTTTESDAKAWRATIPKVPTAMRLAANTLYGSAPPTANATETTDAIAVIARLAIWGLKKSLWYSPKIWGAIFSRPRAKRYLLAAL